MNTYDLHSKACGMKSAITSHISSIACVQLQLKALLLDKFEMNTYDLYNKACDINRYAYK